MVKLGEKPWVRIEEETSAFGKFVVEPLERGYGTTLGNSLRRVLLSSLHGAAITAIKIDGVSHEFSTVPGMLEDVLQLILNLKEVILISHSDTPKTMTLKARGKSEVKAGDIEHDPEIEIVNPDHKIATLESGAKLNIEMTVERGKGFVTADENKKPNLPVGFIPIDSIYAPILKVNMSVEEVRVGQEINYDRLILDVWTNGSIKPEEAVKESAKILARHIDLFVNAGDKIEVAAGEAMGSEEATEQVLEMNVEDLELSARSLNCLKESKIGTVRELLEYSVDELMKLKNFGAKSLKEVRDKLAEYKLTLKGNVEEEE